VVYASRASGNLDLWIMNADGTQQRQLTANAYNNKQPAVSPDGRYIVFVSDQAGTVNVWRIDRDGNNPQQLTSGSGEENPQCTPDGKWVLYTLLGAGKPTIWRVSIAGGAPQPLVYDHSSSPAISPDGKSFACFYRNAQTNNQTKLALFPLDGGQPTRIFDAVINSEIVRRLPPLRWTIDGRALTYVVTAGGSSSFWLQPISGEAARQLTSFKADRIFSFDWSRNGKQVIFSRGTLTSDVVLITTFR
jgi:Tol biopolymer transport system component